MIETVEELTYTHEEFRGNLDEWRFLYHSYLGGAIYQNSSYLTRYQFESNEEYNERIFATPYANHCKPIVHLFNSFIFARQPTRLTGSWADNPQFQDFLEDADMEGRSLNQFMRQVDITSSIFGHAWIIMDKSDLPLQTAAEEQLFGVRPYLSLYNPLNVLDWQWEKQPNGSTNLNYLKVIERVNGPLQTVKIFTPETIETYTYNSDDNTYTVDSIQENGIGAVPAVICYSARSGVNGVGISELTDIARLNKTIYDHTSEMIQIIKLANHPSLVLTPGTQAGAGPGAIIEMESSLDPGLKPYLLQPDSASLDGVRNTIDDLVRSINTIAAVGNVRSVEGRTLSGVALEAENRILNAKLTEKADNLELCEEQLMELWARWQGVEWTGTIDYPDSFNARDKASELASLKVASELATDEYLIGAIQRRVAEIVIDDPEELNEIMNNESVDDELVHDPVTDESLEQHMRDMLSEGYSTEEIKRLHPELLDVLLSGYIDMLSREANGGIQ